MATRLLSTVHSFLPSLRLSEAENAALAVLQAVAAEFVGTFVFVLLGIGSVTSGCHIADIVSASGNSGDTSLGNAAKGSCALQSSTVLNIATAFSFGLFIAIYATAAISGGHLNPAVTLVCFLAGKMSLVVATLYIGAQCLGAIISAAIVKGIDPDGFRAAGGAATKVNTKNGVTPLAAWGVESILTFALVFTVFAATDSGHSAPHLPVLAPFAIGITVFVSHFFAVPLTGCSLNPARSFGPAVMTGAWKDHWVFWAGPCTGALVAFVVYKLLVSRIPFACASEAVEVDDEVTDIVVVGPKHAPLSDVILSNPDWLPAAERSGSRPPAAAMDSVSIGNVMECVTPAGGGRRQSRQAQDSRLSRNPVYSTPTSSIPTMMPRVKTAGLQGRKYMQWPDGSGSPASVNEWRRVVLHGAFTRSHA